MRVAPDQLKWVVDDVIPQTAALKALMGEVTILPGREEARKLVGEPRLGSTL